ncbi:NACHT domain-containing protein [Aeromicrobium stalagmiti]|uniref:NACHT domain-containing protein n=1 Tax=Aeromicrobium stalagmiti TaxID=2738988 RepID=UPI001C2C54FA|nr:hypothetical protein [Aeromicrobium stalagmiti]NRQ51726.1 hypothetical protein [Aeromicrobium stalagmiti]
MNGPYEPIGHASSVASADVEISFGELRDHAPATPVVPVKGQPLLPLAGLEPEVLERLCAEVVAYNSRNQVHFYGRRGQKQYGLDIVEHLPRSASRSGTRNTTVYQVKRFTTLTEKELDDAVRTYAASQRFTANRFVLMTSAPFDHDTNMVDALAGLVHEFDGVLEVDVWGIETMSQKLRTMPNTVHAIFGSAMAQEFCGTAGTPPAVELYRLPEPNSHERTLMNAMRQDYKRDDLIRFEEAELVGPRVDDMFVDVPILAGADTSAGTRLALINPDGGQLALVGTQSGLTERGHTHRSLPSGLSDPDAPHASMVSAGGAQALLHPSWSVSTVLMAGPGQGKSTLLQYVCQFNRARHLNFSEYEADAHELTSVASMPRVPFSVDLRRYATWRRKILLRHEQRDTGPKGSKRKGGWHRHQQKPSRINDPKWLADLPPKVRASIMVEAYVAEDVSASAGGASFDVTDLVEVTSRWPVVFALDGLDEVSPLDDRTAVADQIRNMFDRQASPDSGLDTIILVASRPGAVERPLWEDPRFAAVELGNLVPALKMKYLLRWSAGLNLPEERRKNLMSVFEAEHHKPHVAEVSSSPMQLAILAHLIDTHSVIPAKRTSLYDEYIKIFFNRECEKNQALKKHRPTLMKIHAVIGWWIHSETERGTTDGTIDLETLRTLLFDYLRKTDKSADVVDELFNEMKTRMICLVQRRQSEGRYEFDVQSIREYFAAHFLIKELSTGAAGTRDARLAEIIRRPFWGNVVRFSAGMFDDGELPSIAHALRELKKGDLANHPMVGATAKQLLDDQVFETARASVVHDIVEKVILQGSGVLLAQDGLLRSGTNPFAFHSGAGDLRAIDVLKERLVSEPDDIARRGAAVLLHRQVTRLPEPEVELGTDASPAESGAVNLDTNLWDYWWSHAEGTNSLADRNPAAWLDVAAALHVMGELTDAEDDRLHQLLLLTPDMSPVSTLTQGGRWAPGAGLSDLCVKDVANGAADLNLPPWPTSTNERTAIASDDARSDTEPPGEDHSEPDNEFDRRGALLISGPLGQFMRASDPHRFFAVHSLRDLDRAGRASADESVSTGQVTHRRRIRGKGLTLKLTTHALDAAFDAFEHARTAESWGTVLNALSQAFGDSWLVEQAVLTTPVNVLQDLLRPGAAAAPADEFGQRWRKSAQWSVDAHNNRDDAEWWRAQITAATNGQLDGRTCLLGSISVAHSNVVVAVGEDLNGLAETLTLRELGTTVAAIARSYLATKRANRLSAALRGKKMSPSPRLALLLWPGADEGTQAELPKLVLPGMQELWGSSPAGDDVLSAVLGRASQKIQLTHLKGARRQLARGRVTWLPVLDKLSLGQCADALARPQDWPSDVVRAASNRLEARIGTSTPFLADVAEQNNWDG